MVLKVFASGPQNPLYALSYAGQQPQIIEDKDIGIWALFCRVFTQIIGKRDYSLNNIAKYLGSAHASKLDFQKFGEERNGFVVQLEARDTKILGKIATIELATWEKICNVGQQFLQITHDNWFQTNDDSFARSHRVQKDNQDIITRLQTDQQLQNLCKKFISKCPSRVYRVMVRLALHGCHETSGADPQVFT